MVVRFSLTLTKRVLCGILSYMFQSVPVVHQMDFEGQILRLETGLLARQATASVVASYGQTTVMANVVVGAVRDADYFPLQVIYEEKLYASGKIRGSRFIKREGKPTDNAVLTGRMIDRSLRSLFSSTIRNEIQIIVTVLSVDEVNPPDTVAVLAASAAVSLCSIPSFAGPVSAVRVGFASTSLLDTDDASLHIQTIPQPVVNPMYAQMAESDLDVVVSGDGNNIVMLEAHANEVPEDDMIGYLDFATTHLQTLTTFQHEFIQAAKAAGYVRQTDISTVTPSPQFRQYWHPFQAQLEEALYAQGGKEAQTQALNTFREHHMRHLKLITDFVSLHTPVSLQELKERFEIDPSALNFEVHPEIIRSQVELASSIPDIQHLRFHLLHALDAEVKQIVHHYIFAHARRLDGRGLHEIRPITCQVDVLPRTHGSSLFQRGETQVLNIATLGTLRDALVQDDMEDFDETSKRYLHHYNFPAYSIGETGRYGPPKRREIGHGALAEKALLPVLPSEETFPYTIRLVSECLGSNGSTSMASTCASTLTLMAAGVPIRRMVAGIAMGLMMNTDTGNFCVLSDILGAEDHFGDMDFKVTGTEDGITAIQLDNKVAGLTVQILQTALHQARVGRLHILNIMAQAIDTPRPQISEHAPQVVRTQIPFAKIGDVIGPSGKVIKNIIAQTGVEIDIADDTGVTMIYGQSTQDIASAQRMIEAITKEYTIGERVSGTVYRIEKFGAFVRLVDTGKEGMIHISKLSDRRVEMVEDVVAVGQNVQVEVVKVTDRGQIDLRLLHTLSMANPQN